jgi:hypothetical protein
MVSSIALRKLPRATRNLILITLILGLLGSLVGPIYRPFLALDVSSTSLELLTTPWVFISTTFYETNLISCALVVLYLYHGGKYFELTWVI